MTDPILVWLGVASVIFVVWFTWQAAAGVTAPDGGQTRRQSIIEAWTNILIGFSINFIINIMLLPLVGAELTVANNLWLGAVYTAVSMIRQYAIRRWFNDRIHAVAVALATRTV